MPGAKLSPGMSRPGSTGYTMLMLSKFKSYLYVSGILLVIIIPVALTLATVEHPLRSEMSSNNATPLGYTVSLSMFVLPVTVMALWFLLHPKINFQKKAFYLTLSLLIPIGIVLDLLFAHLFFTFENTGAVSGWSIPGVGGPIPIEEFVFYLTGFAFVLLLYIWGDEYWLSHYNIADYQASAGEVVRLLRFHGSSFLIALLLIAGAIIYKKMFSDVPQGWPWYWIYLILLGFTPAIGFIHAAIGFINWRSFSFTVLCVVLVSIIWEASLALPYQWWDYQHQQMMGIFIKAWHELPLEAVFLWFCVSYSSIIIYEVIKIWLASKKTFRHAFLGS